MTKTAFDREEVLDRLRTAEETRITFIKLNGEERDMLCTNNPEILADYLPPAEAVESQPFSDDELITVFDLDNVGWRSFYLQNLVLIEGVKPRDESPST